ncbi:MAG: DUF6399 domain-containing protein [Nodosilinea sp.]
MSAKLSRCSSIASPLSGCSSFAVGLKICRILNLQLLTIGAPWRSISPNGRWRRCSSSCGEGRNGQLALRHQSFHRLSPRKLQALTTIHNFFLTRPDGSIAAERFFGYQPKPLFDSL